MRQITIVTMFFHDGPRNHQLLGVETLVIGHVTLAGFYEMLYHVLTSQRALLLITPVAVSNSLADHVVKI